MTRQLKVAPVENVRTLRTSFTWSAERRFSGYVVDTAEPTRKFVVELWVDGFSLKTICADDYVHELATQQIGDGCFGFSFSLPDSVLTGTTVIEARLANLGTVVGSPIAIEAPPRGGVDLAGPGAIRWIGGLHFSGWLGEDSDGAAIDILVDGELVMQARALGWTHLANDEDARAVRALNVHLPERFGDGRVRRLSAVTQKGEQLSGSPVTFAAFADGLERAIAALGLLESEKLRGELFDRLMPMSVPLSDYQAWCARFPLPPAAPVAMAGAVMMVGRGNMDDTLDSLNEQSHADWVAAALPDTADPT